MARAKQNRMYPEEWRASTSMAWVYALRMLGMFLVLPVLALHAAELADAENKTQIGLAMGIYGLTQALFQLPLGMASDKFGRKKIIYLGLIVFAAGSFLAAWAESLPMLIAARALQGAGAVSAAVTALVADLTREEVRTRAMAMIGLSIGLTFSFSMVLSPVLTRFLGVPGLFTLMGFLTLLSIGVVAWMTPNPTQSKMHEDAEAQPARISEVLKNGQLLRLNFGIFALQSGLMALFTTLPFALAQLGLDKVQHWKVYLPATLIGLILMVPAIIIGETRNKLKQVFLLGIGLIILSQIGLLFGLNSLWLIGLWLVFYFIGFNILEASMPSLVSKIAPSELKGTAMGVYNTLQSIALFVGGAIGGLLFHQSGYTGVFIFCSALMILWFTIALFAPAPKPVKNVSFKVGRFWINRQQDLKTALQLISGIERISFSTDGETIFIKALQKGFDEEGAKKIISGAE
ncbi:MFS transporter [Neisseria wadsworthii]|uniref:MFS family major facilitator transporter n=1 Tax=Neisseria wadsworthii 9715 TaxID=1030841 RepID=G4CQ98_9NEIS|nr:MFS transporter [Neisseria wadsworthii]EGZ46673.1 MFS family major facilitator transporter [Neisseria wadsworthii 9715]QMT35023.1 MFS transporter [Neisseria wadsworthii]